MFNEDVALRSDLVSYIKRFGVEPKDLKNLDLTSSYVIPVANNNIWLSYKASIIAEGSSIPIRNTRGNILGNTAVDDNELITFGQVKSLIKNPFTPKGEVNTVNELPTNAQVGWLYTVLTANVPDTPGYNPDYPTVNVGDMVIYLTDEDTGIGYWDSFSGFVDLSVLTLQRVLENGNISTLPATFGDKVTVKNGTHAVELNTYLDNGFLSVKELTGNLNVVHFAMKNWNQNVQPLKVEFKSTTNNTETVVYESDLSNYVSYKTNQNKTEEEKALARKNLGVDSLSFEWSAENW